MRAGIFVLVFKILIMSRVEIENKKASSEKYKLVTLFWRAI